MTLPVRPAGPHPEEVDHLPAGLTGSCGCSVVSPAPGSTGARHCARQRSSSWIRAKVAQGSTMRPSRTPGMHLDRTTRRRLIGAGSAALVGALAQPTRAAFGFSAPLGSPPTELSGHVIWPQDPD